MNVKFKKALALSSAAVIGTSVITVNAATLTKTLKAEYHNIKVTYDGKLQQPNLEPFMVNGSVYVGLRDAGQMTNNNVTWDGASKTVHITSKAQEPSVDSEELAKKNLQIASLTSEVEDLEDDVEEYKKKIAELEKLLNEQEEEEETLEAIDKDSIDDLLDDLDDDYDGDFSVSWFFELGFDSKDEIFELEILFESDDDGENFSEISQSSLNRFITNICEDIQSEFGAFPIEGELIDDYEGDVLAEFTFDEEEEFDINRDYPMSIIQNFEDVLEEKFSDLMEISSPELKDIDINVTDVYLDPNSDFDEVVFHVYTDFEDTEANRDAWKELSTGIHTRNLESGLKDIRGEISKFFNADEIDGYVLNAEEEIIVKFEDGRLRLEDF